jgi:hypothetical protein
MCLKETKARDLDAKFNVSGRSRGFPLPFSRISFGGSEGGRHSVTVESLDA